jgi:hypothetical protein
VLRRPWYARWSHELDSDSLKGTFTATRQVADRAAGIVFETSNDTSAAYHAPAGREIEAARTAFAAAVSAQAAEQAAQVALLRCIFGNPFRALPRRNLAWLAWEGGTVTKLAAMIYEERAFDRLPILADALEEAGCEAAELLTHLRGPRPHVRGVLGGRSLAGEGIR